MARKKKPVETKKIEMPVLEQPRTRKEKARKWGKLIGGIIVILLGLFLTWTFLPEFLVVLKGTIGVIILLVGILVVALGWLD